MIAAMLVVTCYGLSVVLWPMKVCANETGIAQIKIDQPRAFGYQLGDTLKRVVQVTLPETNRLDITSLPERGRVSPSLVIDEPRIEERRAERSIKYKITLTYQIINVHPEVSDIPVPSHHVRYHDGDNELQFLIPASRIGVSMLRGRTAGPEIQPNQRPMPLPQHDKRIALLSIVFAFSLLALLFIIYGSPFGTRGPFVRVHRALKKFHPERWDDARYGAALRLVHQGFDETAGQTVFPEHLDAFFAKHEAFNAMRDAIVEFFVHSRGYFFGRSAHGDGVRYSYADLSRLVAQLRNIERARA